MAAPSMHKVFFIGAGPGDRKHLTIEGLKILKSCGLVFAMNIYSKTYGPFLRRKKVIDPSSLDFDQVVAITSAELKKCSVAFLVPGDHSVFSPFQAFIEHFGGRAVQVAGVGLLNAASAVLRTSLDRSDVANTIVLTSSRTKGSLLNNPVMDGVGPDVTLVLYMNHVPLDQLVAVLSPKMGRNCPAAVLYNVSLPGENAVIGTLDDIAGKASAADLDRNSRVMATVIVGRVLGKGSGRTSWNFINRLSRQEMQERKAH